MDIVSVGEKVFESAFAHFKVSGNKLTLGPATYLFESVVGAQVGRQAVSVNSGTAALRVAFLLAKKLGVESITVPEMTVPMVYREARRVFDVVQQLDVDVSDFSITGLPTTDAVCVVSTGGIPSSRLAKYAMECSCRGLFVIEDASHSHGCRFGDASACTLGNVSVQSWFATKTLTMGEGGVIFLRRISDTSFAEAYVNQGKPRGSASYLLQGENFRASEFSCALGLADWEYQEETFTARRKLAAKYLGAGMQYPMPDVNVQDSGFYKFPIIVPSKKVADAIADDLKKNEFQVPGLIHNPYLENESGSYGAYTCENARFLSNHHVCLPISRRWTEDRAELVIRIVRRNGG